MKAYLPIILIILSVGAYYMFIKPTYSDVKILMEDKKNSEEVLQKAKGIITKRDEMTSSYNALSPEEKDKLKKIVPDVFDGPMTAYQINSIASKQGMIINDVKIIEAETNSPEMMVTGEEVIYKTHKVAFVVEGRYENFVAFIKDLDSSLNIIDINTISISISGTDKESKEVKSQSMKYSIDFQTYSLN